MPLTAIAATRAAPKPKPYKLADEKGLYLLVKPDGSKYWRYKYRYLRREKLLALGTFETTTLAEARDKRDAAHKLLKNGTDPSVQRATDKRAQKLAVETAFEVVARAWHEKQKNLWTERHSGYVIRRLESDIFPPLGKRPIAEIEPPEILAAIRKIERRGAHEMARRARQYCSNIFKFAIAEGNAKRDPAADVTEALEKAPRERHFAALAAKDLPEFLEKLARYDGYPQTRLALRLLLLTGVRTSELISATWGEFHLDAAEWHLPGERMKMGEPHMVPLSRQSLAVLVELRKADVEPTDFVFPAIRNSRQPMSNNTCLFALYRMGYHSRATGHGMRTLFSTVLNESGRFRPDLIEHQLAHKEKDSVRAAYNRAQYSAERREMMGWWGNFISGAESGGKVAHIRKHVAA